MGTKIDSCVGGNGRIAKNPGNYATKKMNIDHSKQRWENYNAIDNKIVSNKNEAQSPQRTPSGSVDSFTIKV